MYRWKLNIWRGSPDGRQRHAFVSRQYRCHRSGNKKHVEDIAGSSIWLEFDLDDVLGTKARNLFCHCQPLSCSATNGKTHRTGRDLSKFSNSNLAVNGLEHHIQYT